MICFLVSSFEVRPDLLFTTINRIVMQRTRSRNSTTTTPASVGVMTSTTIADASSEELESEVSAIRLNCLVHMFSDGSKLTIISLLFYCLKYLDDKFRYSHNCLSRVTDITQGTKRRPKLCVKYNKHQARSIKRMNFGHILLGSATDLRSPSNAVELRQGCKQISVQLQ